MENENSVFTLSKANELAVTEGELRFVFTQAENLLKESLGSGDSVLNRSTVLLSILLGIITSIIGFLVGVISTSPSLNKLPASLVITSLYLAFALYRLTPNLFGTDYQVLGSQPKDLLHNWYFEQSKKAEARSKDMLLSEVKEYQGRIVFNNILNKKRWARFHFALILTTCAPAVFLFCFIVFSIFLPS